MRISVRSFIIFGSSNIGLPANARGFRRVFAMTVNKGGPKIKHTQEGSCVPRLPDTPIEPPTKPGETPNFCGIHEVVYYGLNRKLEMKGVTLDDLARFLARSNPPDTPE